MQERYINLVYMNTELLLPLSPDAAENIKCGKKFQQASWSADTLPQKILSVSLAQNPTVQTCRRKPFSYQSHDRLSESLSANLWLLEQFTKALVHSFLAFLCLVLQAAYWARSAFTTAWYNHSYRAEAHQNNFIHTTKQTIFTLGLAVLARVLLNWSLWTESAWTVKNYKYRGLPEAQNIIKHLLVHFVSWVISVFCSA